MSETARTNFFKISSHNLHNVFNKVWNFHWDWFNATYENFKFIVYLSGHLLIKYI